MLNWSSRWSRGQIAPSQKMKLMELMPLLMEDRKAQRKVVMEKRESMSPKTH